MHNPKWVGPYVRRALAGFRVRARCLRGIRPGGPAACAGYVTFTTLAASVTWSRPAPDDGAPRAWWPGAGEFNGCRTLPILCGRVRQPLVRAALRDGARGAAGACGSAGTSGTSAPGSQAAGRGCPASSASTTVVRDRLAEWLTGWDVGDIATFAQLVTRFVQNRGDPP
jgi:hypothetical protein